MSVAFSSNEEECVNRKVPVVGNIQATPSNELGNAYELDGCAKWIEKNGFDKVGLLFPNNAWPDRDSVEIFLKKRTGCKIVNLDVPHTSCCFNEKNTTRHNLQCMIRFGHSCLTPHTIRFPVLYAFGRRPLDCENTSEEFRKLFPDRTSHVIILYEVFYSHVVGDLMAKLRGDYQNIVLSRLNIPKHQVLNDSDGSDLQTGNIINNTSDLQRITKCGRYFDNLSLEDFDKYDVFYIGSENSSLKNLMVSLNTCRYFCYDPWNRTTKQSNFDVNRYLRQRYHYIERTKDAKIICIVISTTTLPNCIAIVDHLRNVILKSGKKSRQLHLTEELTTQKLGNYLEVDVFVYVACPEATLVDSRELYQPVITPYELEVALNKSREWTSSYVTDYNELLPGGAAYVPLTVRDESEADVSLITGRSRTLVCSEENSSSSSVALRGEMNVANINSVADFLQNRSWRGLEQHLGETPVAEIVQGMKGLAAGYEGEGEGSEAQNIS